MADSRLIVALDVSTMDDMKHIVETLGDSVSFYKVGMELFYAVGTDAIVYLQDKGKDIFLDLKMHDIPNTVAQGVCSLMQYDVTFLTLHAQGGRLMMERASQEAKEKAERLGVRRPKLLAITVLTSFDEAIWSETGGTLPIADRVVALAKLAKESGMDGVVASPLESARIREVCGEDFLIVTPGVRPHFAGANDQKRVATPREALSYGSTHIVVGRPITRAEVPREAVRCIVEEMEGV